jgi:hypothetical protein
VSVSQAVPTEESPGGDIARRLAAALGTAWQAGDTTHNAALLLAIGDAFADLYADQDIATNQAFVNTATVMLSELEERYGLTVRIDMSTADRQTRLLSKVRAARAGTPQGIERSITPYDPTVTVAENLSSDPLPRRSERRLRVRSPDRCIGVQRPHQTRGDPRRRSSSSRWPTRSATSARARASAVMTHSR